MSEHDSVRDATRRQAPPLRSLVFLPGDRIDAVTRAMDSGVDACVIDLAEPRTPFDERERSDARRAIGEHLAALSAGSRPLQYVRVRPPWSGFMLRDLADVVHANLAGILVPGVTGPDDIVAADALLTNVERERDLEVGRIVLYPILETAQSIRLAYEIAEASPRVAHLGGAISRGGDLCEALSYQWSAEGRETLFLRSKVLIDARAAGIRYPIGGMWGGEPDDLDGFRAFGEELRGLGYFGMLLKELSHVPLANEIFSPSKAELEEWLATEQAATEAEQAGKPAELAGPDGTVRRVKASYVGAARAGLGWARALGLVE